MKVLLVAATAFELQSIRKEVEENAHDFPTVDFLVSGVGLTATAYALGKTLAQNQYDLALNVGIAGQIGTVNSLGQVVEVESEYFADLGAESKDAFLDVFDLEFEQADKFPFQQKRIYAQYPTGFRKLHNLPTIDGISVNKVHGKEESIKKLEQKFSSAVESMEGAAFFYACAQSKQDCMQFRAISNQVEVRNKANWKIDFAIQNLTVSTLQFLKQLRNDQH